MDGNLNETFSCTKYEFSKLFLRDSNKNLIFHTIYRKRKTK